MENTKVRFAQDIITPPPITHVVEKLDKTNEKYPGDVFVDEHGQLLKRYLDFRGFAKPLVEAYNNWVTKIIGKQVGTYPIELKDGTVITFTRITIDNPTFYSTTRNYVLDYPALASSAGRTYSSNVFVTIESNKGRKSEPIPMFKIPVMVGSVLDNLTGKTNEQLLQYGHDPSDPNGWFVINGTEKIVLLIEKLRANRPLLYFDSVEMAPTVKYTCTTVRGSRVITLIADRNKLLYDKVNRSRTAHIRINLQFMGKGKGKWAPVFILYKVLGVTDVSTMVNMVLEFVKPEQREKVWLALQPSVIEANSVNDIEFISYIKGIQANTDVATKTRLVTNSVIEDLFPQIPYDNKSGKLKMLSILVARLGENMAGVREFDDRDSWSNKRIDSAAKSMEQLFMGLWTKTIENLKEEIEKSPATTFDKLVSMLKNNTITDEFISSFSSNNWGVKEKYNKENITDILKRDNQIATYSHLLRITITGSSSKKKKTKSPHIREVQSTALGIICPAETPEGEACGITKNLAVTAYISLDRDDDTDATLNHIIFDNDFLSDNAELGKQQRFMYNGIFYGWCNGAGFRNYLRDLRRSGQIPFDVCIRLDKDGYLYVYTDGSRPVRPLLIVTNNKLVIREKGMWNAPFEQLIGEGCVEYLDPFEQEEAYIAQSIWDLDAKVADQQRMLEFYQNAEEIYNTLGETEVGNFIIQTDKEGIEKVIRTKQQALETMKEAAAELEVLNKKVNYSHCELDPNAIMGLSASLMPMPERSPAPRVTYQAGMQKQALSIYHSHFTSRFDTNIKVLAYPTRPLFETQLSEYLELKAGQTVTMAMMTYEGFNQEDAIIFNQQSLDNGLFTIIKYSKYSAIEKQIGDIVEEIARPKIMPGEPAEKYGALDENGVPRIGSQVREGDFIIGRVRRNRITGDVENASIPLGIGESGVIDDVLVTYNPQSQRVIRVKIRDVRAPEKGDKFASRYAQKGVIGRIVPVEDMPFNPDTGVRPDIIVNPHAIPSRMTIGKLIEIIASKHAALKGEKVSATPFRPFDLSVFERSLRDYGYNEKGLEPMVLGTTGEMLQVPIYMGPCYYQALRHHVKDKFQVRSIGGYRPITRTPIGGRSIAGGRAIRAGEMEQASFVSHGAAALLPERMCESSDKYTTVWCQTCGTIALHNVISRQFICRKCRGKGNFGKVKIPYTFKVLTQYLSGVGFNISAKLAKEGEAATAADAEVEPEAGFDVEGVDEEHLSEDEYGGEDVSDNED